VQNTNRTLEQQQPLSATLAKKVSARHLAVSLTFPSWRQKHFITTINHHSTKTIKNKAQ
jgi:hypothetical protein